MTPNWKDDALNQLHGLVLCRRCGHQMKPSKAIAQTYGGIPDFAGGHVVTMSPGGPGKLIDCLKCVNCGHSISSPNVDVRRPNMDTQDLMIHCMKDEGRIYECNVLRNQLAATEAICQQYREALEKLLTALLEMHYARLNPNWFTGGKEKAELHWWVWEQKGLEFVKQALAIPSPTVALNAAIAEELERMADGFMSNDPVDETKFMQYYGSHIRGVLNQRAKELRVD